MSDMPVKAKWIICDLGRDSDIKSLFYGVQECGREVEVLSLKETYEILEVPDNERKCIVTSGSIGMNELRRKTKPNWVGCWHEELLFNCSTYYANWGQYVTQQRYVMLPFAAIKPYKNWLYENSTLAHDGGDLFFRPNSGAKEFDGARISPGRFKAWYDDTEDILKTKGIPLNLLCVIAEARDLFREYRLVIKNGKVVTGSLYRLSGHIAQEPFEESFEKDIVKEFAEKALADNPPRLPPVHVLDIAMDSTGPSILEVGCYCCAGLYDSDRRKIALAVSEAAEEEFAKIALAST